MTAKTVDEGIKLWLSRKGEDLEKIEQLGGTLTRGLLMVLHALPRRDKDKAKVTPARRQGNNGLEFKAHCREKFNVQRHSALTRFVTNKVKERERKHTNLAANLLQEHPGIPSTFNPMSTIEQKTSPGLPKYEVVDEGSTSNRHSLFDNEAAVAVASSSLLSEQEATAVAEIESLLLDCQTSAHHSAWKGLERLGLKKRLVNESSLEPEITDLTPLVNSIYDRELVDLDKAPPSDPMAKNRLPAGAARPGGESTQTVECEIG